MSRRARGPDLPALAWRNLWRNPRRTAITLSSIALGTTLAVLFTAIGDSNWADMIDLAARLGGGHVTLQHPDYFDAPTVAHTVSGTAALRDLAQRDPGVDRAVARVAGHLMLSTATHSYGAAFLAFDPQAEDATTLSLLEAPIEGGLFATREQRGIVLGAKLAENLDAGVGRKVVFTMTDKSGEIVQEAVRVTGVLRTGAPSVDGGLVLLPLGPTQRMLGFGPEEAIQVAVFLKDQRRAAEVAKRLGAELPPGVTARPWYEIQPDLSSFIAMKVASATFIEFVIMLLVAAGIFNTLFVSVMERLREFGILRALGFTPGGVFALVMAETLWLALVGLALAALLAAGPYAYLATTGIDLSARMGIAGSEVAGVAVAPVLRAAIYGEHLLWIALFALGATLLAGIYPAWHAGRVAPVDAMRA